MVTVTGPLHRPGSPCSFLLSLYSLAAHGRRRDGFLGLLAGMVTFPVLALAGVPDLRTSDVLLAWALLVTSWAVGDAIRSRRAQQRDQVRAAEQEAAALASRPVERSPRNGCASRASCTTSWPQHVADRRPGWSRLPCHPTDVDAAEEALDVIAETSRQALAQTRSLLGMLRERDDPVGGSPTQSIGDLEALVEGVRAAGVDVTPGHRRHTPQSRRSGRAHRVPHRAGVADERPQARRLGPRPRSASATSSDSVEVEVVNTGERGPAAARSVDRAVTD